MHQWIVCAAVLALGGSTAMADRFELGFATGTRWMRSTSVDTLTDGDAHPVAGIGGAMRLPGVRLFGFDLYVDAEYQFEGMSGTTYQRIDSELSMHALRAGARLERKVKPWLWAFGRATVGYSTASLSLTDRFSNAARPTSDRAHAATSSLGGGVSVPVLRHPRANLALRLEADYTKVSGLHFEAEPQMADDGMLTIPVLSASLGDVDISGASLRFGVFGRF